MGNFEYFDHFLDWKRVKKLQQFLALHNISVRILFISSVNYFYK